MSFGVDKMIICVRVHVDPEGEGEVCIEFASRAGRNVVLEAHEVKDDVFRDLMESTTPDRSHKLPIALFAFVSIGAFHLLSVDVLFEALFKAGNSVDVALDYRVRIFPHRDMWALL